MEKTTPPINQIAIAETLEQRFFDMALEVAVHHAYCEGDVKRYKHRRFYFEIESGESECLQKATHILAKALVHRLTSTPLHGYEHRVPCACGTQSGLCFLNLRMAAG